MSEKIIINDVEYDSDSLTEDAKKLITNLKMVDGEIHQLQNKIAFMQTARAAYAQALDNELKK